MVLHDKNTFAACSELSEKNSVGRDDFKWGSRHSPPLLHSSLHYPASETPVTTMLLGTKKWNSPPPVRPFFSLPSTRSHSSPPRNQSKKSVVSSRNWNHTRGGNPAPYSQVAPRFRLSGATPPRPPKHQHQHQQKNAASSGDWRKNAGSSVDWRKHRPRGGRVAKKTAPRTRRCRLTRPPRAPANSTQMLMHLYNAATTKKNKNKTGVRPVSSLASPRLDDTPRAASIGHLLRGQIDTFGTLLRTLRRDNGGGGYNHGVGYGRDNSGEDNGGAITAATAMTPPFSPVVLQPLQPTPSDNLDDDMNMNHLGLDTFGSNLDDRDPLRRGGEQTTPPRRSFSTASTATNLTWLGDEDEDDQEEKDFTPSSPVAWTSASPAPHHR
jgi:hypothetical protein